MVLFDIVKMKLEKLGGIIGGIGVCSKHCASSTHLLRDGKEKAKYQFSLFGWLHNTHR